MGDYLKEIYPSCNHGSVQDGVQCHTETGALKTCFCMGVAQAMGAAHTPLKPM